MQSCQQRLAVTVRCDFPRRAHPLQRDCREQSQQMQSGEGATMRWVVKTSLDGRVYDEMLCDGTPPIPDNGSKLLVPVDGRFVAAVVTETSVEQNQQPAILRITCVSPEAFAKH